MTDMDRLEDITCDVQGNEYFNLLLDLGYTGEQAMDIMQCQAEEANEKLQ